MARTLQLVRFPKLRSVVGTTDEELELLRDFYRRSYNEDYDVSVHRLREQPRHEVEVASFELGTVPVTNENFQEFVADVDYHGGSTYVTHGERAGSKSTWRSPVGRKKREAFFSMEGPDDPCWLQHPLTCIDWVEALMFCHWLSAREGTIDPRKPGERLADFIDLFRPQDSATQPRKLQTHLRWPGYRLPTSAEWEAASRHDPSRPESVNPAPWWWGGKLEEGDGKINSADYTSKRRFRRWVTCPWEGTHAYTSPVGSFPPTPSGLYDMAGNVWEWCLDTFHPDFYARGTREDPLCLWDPREGDREGFPLPPRRIARGGGWHNLPANIRQASRRVHEPERVRCNLGVRVARTL